MIWRITLGALGALIALGILIVGAGWAFLHLPAFEASRHQVAASFLSSYLGETVAVDGDVEVTFGQTIDVSASGVSPVAGAQGVAKPVGTVRLSFAGDAALRGRLLLTRLDVSQIRVIIDAAAERQPSAALGERIAGRVEAFLSSPLIRNLEVEDLEFRRINDPSGWNESLVLDKASARAIEAGGAISVDVRGSLNGKAFTFSGKLPDLTESSGTAAGGRVSLRSAVAGLEAELDGQLLRDAAGLRLTAGLEARSASLGDLEEVLELARAVEGTGTLSLALDGALAELAIASGQLRLALADGPAIEVQGSVDDIWANHGVSLSFAATHDGDREAPAGPGLDLSISAIRGQLSSTERGFKIDDVVVETDLAALELQKIGPIRIGRILRDDRGRLQLEDIRLLQGDPKDPTLDLNGRLGDVLNLSEFSIEGSFRIGMAGLLMEHPNTNRLGDLKGRVSVSDSSGQPRMEALDAKLTGTELMSLSMRYPADGASVQALQLRLAVPDLGQLSAAVGSRASASVGVGFDGTIDVAGEGLRLRGVTKVGKTDLDGRLRLAAPAGSPEITGTIHTPDLYIDDLIAARDLTRVFPDPGIDAVTLREDLPGKTTLALDIAADAIESQGRRHGSLAARVEFGNARLRIAPLELAYLGGHLTGAVSARFGAASPSLEANVQIRALSLARLFERLDKAKIASGSLDLDLAVSGEGDDLPPLLASLTGEVSGSIRDGSLADRTVNLAGQNIIAWAFTPSADGSAPLECLEARFAFERGIGSVERLVFETDKVQAVGGGTLNLRNASMDLVFTPRPKRKALISEIGSVAISGPFAAPRVKLADGAVAAKVVGDTIGLPIHLLNALVGAGGSAAAQRRPCVVVTEPNALEPPRPRREPSESPFLSPQ